MDMTNLQLATTVDIISIKFPCRVELKLNGVRSPMIDGKFYTRKGKNVYLPQIAGAISNNTLGFMVDMEMYVNEGKNVDRQIVSGLQNSARVNPIDESRLKFGVFDIMATDAFINAIPIGTYAERLHDVDVFLNTINHPQFIKVPHWDVTSLIQLKTLYDEQVALGYEGLVVKWYQDTYKFKRTKQWARFKATNTADLECYNYNLGTGRNSDVIGALLLEGEVDGKHVTVKVGQLTDELRSKPFEYFNGKTIEVKYEHVTTDVDGAHSLFQPRFVCIRDDK